MHALSEIRRVLLPDGILIDLRPMLDRWQVQVVSARQVQNTGRLQDFPNGLADDNAANQAMAQAEKEGWFAREAQEFFLIDYAWDTPKEMEEWIKDEWHDFIDLDEESRQATRSAWAVGDPDSLVRVRVKMLITRWRKQ